MIKTTPNCFTKPEVETATSSPAVDSKTLSTASRKNTTFLEILHLQINRQVNQRSLEVLEGFYYWFLIFGLDQLFRCLHYTEEEEEEQEESAFIT